MNRSLTRRDDGDGRGPVPSRGGAPGPEPGAGRAALVVADWGTTSCRFALVAADGAVLDRATGRGIMPVLADAEQTGPSAEQRAALFEAELRRQIGHWLEASPGIAVLLCGMIGSNTGWVDAGYREVPCELVVDPGDLAPAPLAGHQAWIVPGLIIRGAAPDIMRGEETQALGALLEAGGGAEHLVIAPGTHSKWVRIRGGQVTDFRSYLTGELFTALREHTIIGRGVPDPAQSEAAGDGPVHATEQHAREQHVREQCTREQEAFVSGLARSQDGDGASLLHTVFSARTRMVAGDLEAAAVPAYLSGLLIGDEVADGLAATEAGPDTIVTVIGSADLAERYRAALAHAGITARVAGQDATLHGLLAIADTAGWLDIAPGHVNAAEEENA